MSKTINSWSVCENFLNTLDQLKLTSEDTVPSHKLVEFWHPDYPDYED